MEMNQGVRLPRKPVQNRTAPSGSRIPRHQAIALADTSASFKVLTSGPRTLKKEYRQPVTRRIEFRGQRAHDADHAGAFRLGGAEDVQNLARHGLAKRRKPPARTQRGGIRGSGTMDFQGCFFNL